MTQKVLDEFLVAVRAATNKFTESRSSLRHLISALRGLIRQGDFTPISFDAALRLTKSATDARLTKYHPAIRTLCAAWGAPEVVVPRVVHRPPPRIVSDAVASLPAAPLVERHHDGLMAMSRFAVGDATTFQCKIKAVLDREKAVRASPTRLLDMQQGETAAGGKRSYPQAILRSVHEKVTAAEAGICTTFALAAAHVLTGGARQDRRTARVEIVGCARGLATHMYVVVGRQGRLDDHTTWGSGCLVVDCWQAAMQDGGACRYDPSGWPEDHWMLTRLGQFYDSTAADPTVDDLAQQVDVESLGRNMERRQREAEARRKDEADTSEFAPKACPACGKMVAAALLAGHKRSCKGALVTS